MNEVFHPKLLSTLKNYNTDLLRRDILSGITVGIVALPLCIAFAIASGLSPERGLITGVIGGLFISLLGGSRVQIGGPAGAFIVIVYGILMKYGMQGLLISTIMAGVLLIIMGYVKLGGIIKFIPQPVITGFTSGIAVIIFVSQLPDLLGLNLPHPPAEFDEKITAIIHALPTFNHWAFIIFAATVALSLTWGRWIKSVPGPFVALVVLSIVTILFNIPVETIGDRYGNLPTSLPPVDVPTFSFATLRGLLMPATTIAILVAIESLLSAVVADGITGYRHRSNTELIGQGVANIASALFGGMPATGTIARTMTNIRNGGTTPIAGIVHAFTLLLIMLLFSQWAALIPLSVLAGILAIVAFNMFEYHSFVAQLRNPKSDVTIMLLTFLLTIIIDLTVAIEVGMVLAAFSFMKRMSGASNIVEIVDQEEPGAHHSREPKAVQVFEVSGALFFGAVYKFKEVLNVVSRAPKVILLKLTNVNIIDGSGLYAIEELHRNCLKRGTTLIITGIHAQPYVAAAKAGLLTKLGKENVFGTDDDGSNRIKEILGATFSDAETRK